MSFLLAQALVQIVREMRVNSTACRQSYTARTAVQISGVVRP
jgi:hypothetical protein